MNKKTIILISMAILVLIAGVVLVSGCGKKNEAKIQNSEKEVFQKEETESLKDLEDLEEEVFDLGDGWEIYRNYKFGFEVAHPVDWKLEIKDSDPNKASLNDSFYFKKDERVYFAVLTNGGFGHGIQTPRITNQLFKEKSSKMFWYKSNNFPSYIYILENYPKNWGEKNTMELMDTTENGVYLEILEKIYKEFKFIQ